MSKGESRTHNRDDLSLMTIDKMQELGRALQEAVVLISTDRDNVRCVIPGLRRQRIVRVLRSFSDEITFYISFENQDYGRRVERHKAKG